ncbi:nuclear pore complex protein DDB_G0274915-like isoform X2 [Macrobrachium nipponense]|uniref:nuclear pore complex protein DDB_G0274915-like isoform X2 n=1 Tax=Macrobrachium nipponense TaxID=159736 RepID=UPI0030C81142
MGGSGATTLYSREDGATVLEAADGTTTVLQPQHTQGSAAHRLTLTVEGGDGVVSGEGVTAIVDNRAGTATFVEGAEVVRTVAVSYATPILHHVFLQAAPPTTTMHHPHTTHATLLQTTHVPAAAIIQPTSTARRPPTLHTSTTPIILQPARATLKEENGGGRVMGSGSVTTTTTTCSSSSGTTPICLGDAPTTVTSSSTSSSTTTSPTSLSFSPAPSPPLSLSPPSSSPSSGLGLSSSSSSSCNSKADDELTSLSWLQDSNLLRGTALSPVKPSQGLGDMNGAEVVKAESPTSDYGDESSDALEPGELTLNDQPHTQPSRSQPIPYNPQVHIKAKPPYSFSCLIFMAIEDSNNKALPVKDIYAWILEHFPYFRKAPTGWKNSVRHNLSLNKCFRKVEKAPNLGKGSLWMVDPAYRPNLLQALSKTPFHPYSNLDRIYMVSTKAAFLNKPVLCRQLGETLSSPSQGSTQRAAASPETVTVSSSKPAGANVPNPELFPYLARRLGSSSAGLDTLGSTGLGTSPSGVHSEDVDAAAAMLALKHGPRILTPTNLSYSRLREGRDTSVLYEENTSRKRKRKRKHTEIGDARMMVISSSPSEDHSYTSMDGEEEEYPTLLLPPPPPSQATPTTSLASHCHPSPSKKVHHSPTSSVDEAFSDDSYDSDVGSEASQAEMRQLVEGADALLNLAAVATSLASKHILEGDSTSYSNHHYPDSANQNTQMKIASFRPQKLHILKSPKSSKMSLDKTKNTSEILTNNNTIVNNNNKILKVKRFGGSQLQGTVKHLPASR